MENNGVCIHRISFVPRNDDCEIVPAHIVVGQGDTIVFASHSGKIEVNFTDMNIFDPPTGAIQLEGSIRPLAVSFKRTGVYPFRAYSHYFKKFARGGSDGEIIIQSSE